MFTGYWISRHISTTECLLATGSQDTFLPHFVFPYRMFTGYWISRHISTTFCFSLQNVYWLLDLKTHFYHILFFPTTVFTGYWISRHISTTFCFSLQNVYWLLDLKTHFYHILFFHNVYRTGYWISRHISTTFCFSLQNVYWLLDLKTHFYHILFFPTECLLATGSQDTFLPQNVYWLLDLKTHFYHILFFPTECLLATGSQDTFLPHFVFPYRMFTGYWISRHISTTFCFSLQNVYWLLDLKTHFYHILFFPYRMFTGYWISRHISTTFCFFPTECLLATGSQDTFLTKKHFVFPLQNVYWLLDLKTHFYHILFFPGRMFTGYWISRHISNHILFFPTECLLATGSQDTFLPHFVFPYRMFTGYWISRHISTTFCFSLQNVYWLLDLKTHFYHILFFPAECLLATGSQDTFLPHFVFPYRMFTGYWISRHISTTFCFSLQNVYWLLDLKTHFYHILFFPTECLLATGSQDTFLPQNVYWLLDLKTHFYHILFFPAECLLHIKPPWHNFRSLSLLWISSMMTPPHYERFRLVKHTEQFQTRTTLCWHEPFKCKHGSWTLLLWVHAKVPDPKQLLSKPSSGRSSDHC